MRIARFSQSKERPEQSSRDRDPSCTVPSWDMHDSCRMEQPPPCVCASSDACVQNLEAHTQSVGNAAAYQLWLTAAVRVLGVVRDRVRELPREGAFSAQQRAREPGTSASHVSRVKSSRCYAASWTLNNGRSKSANQLSPPLATPNGPRRRHKDKRMTVLGGPLLLRRMAAERWNLLLVAACRAILPSFTRRKGGYSPLAIAPAGPADLVGSLPIASPADALHLILL